MKNRSAAITRGTLTYVKAYRAIAGNVLSTILFQQLEWRFEKHPDGFYKFMQPTLNHPKYRAGDSWTEELAFSIYEFRTAFDQIGVRYSSKAEYDAAPEKFKSIKTVLVEEEGKRMRKPLLDEAGNPVMEELLYCSYYNRNTGETYYFRNHPLVDRLLNELAQGKRTRTKKARHVKARPAGSREYQHPGNGQYQHPGNGQYQHPGNGQYQHPGNGKCQGGEVDRTNIPEMDTTNTHPCGFTMNPHGSNPHTQNAPAGAGVCGHEPGGKYSPEIYLAYAETQKGVNYPAALARALADGRSDAAVERWLAGREARGAPPAPVELPGERDDELLAALKAAMGARLNPSSYTAWVEPISGLSRDGSALHLAAPPGVVRVVEGQYGDVLYEALDELGLAGTKVQLHSEEAGNATR